MTSVKKREKTQAKLAKKQIKAEIKSGRRKGEAGGKTSPAVRYAEFVRGGLYILMGGSLIVALLLGQRGTILSLDDLIDSLFAARAGKVVLALIAIALLIYGMKHLRIVR